MFTSRRISTMGGDKFKDEFSLELDGSNDYIHIPSTTFNVHNSTHSFAFWVKRSAINSWDIVLGNSAHSNYDFILFDQDGGDRLIIEGPDGDSAVGDCSVVADRWYHFVVVSNGDESISMYQDGNSINISSDNVTAAMAVDNIGGSKAGNHLTGNISEMAIYNTALTASQVKTLYNGREPYNHKEGVASGNLTHWWRMGDGRLDGARERNSNLSSDDSSQDNIISDEVDSTLGPELYTHANSLSTNEADDQSTGISALSGITLVDETSITNNSGRSLKYTSVGNGDGFIIDLTSDIDLTVGSVYRISVDARHIGSGTTNQSIRVCENSSLNTTGETIVMGVVTSGQTTFETYTAYFIHNDTTTRYFGARESGDNDGGLYLDNLSIKRVNGNPGIISNINDVKFSGDTP